jgi:polyphenol oxidase
MHIHDKDTLRYYTFESLADQPLVQAVITRRGGVSDQPWASLNLGGTVGDDPQHVSTNRQRAFDVLGLNLEKMYDVWQVHSATVVTTERPRLATEPHLKADAILTDRPGLALFMRFADCVPILLYDPRRKVIGLAHAGWRGTVIQTAGQAVKVMQAAYGSDPADLLAAIGPSIGPHHYEVGPDVVAQVQDTFGKDAPGLLHASNGSGHGVQFDLWTANRLVLERAGVRQVEIAGICTVCHLQDWYSHRGELGKTGRFGAVIQLGTARSQY